MYTVGQNNRMSVKHNKFILNNNVDSFEQFKINNNVKCCN